MLNPVLHGLIFGPAHLFHPLTVRPPSVLVVLYTLAIFLGSLTMISIITFFSARCK